MPYGTGWIKDRAYIINEINPVNEKVDEKKEKCPECGGIGVEHGCIGEGLCLVCFGKGEIPIKGKE